MSSDSTHNPASDTRLPKQLFDLLESVAGSETPPATAPRHWSLADIDALLRDATRAPLPPAPTEAPPEDDAPSYASVAPEEVTEPPPEDDAPSHASVAPEEVTEPPPEDDTPSHASVAPEEVTDPPPEDNAPSHASIAPEEVTEPPPPATGMRFDLFMPEAQQQQALLEKPTQVAPGLPIEKPGLVLRRVDIEMTSDLSPVPKIVPAENLLHQRQAPPPPEEDIPEGQQKLQGFDEPPPPPLPPDELQRRVAASRAHYTSQFSALRNLGEKLEETGETGTALPQDAPALEPPPRPPFEFEEPKQRDSVFRHLVRQRARRARRCLALSGLALGGLALEGLTLLVPTLTLRTPLISSLLLVLLGTNIGLLASDYNTGLRQLLRRQPNADSLLPLAGVLALASTVLSFVPATDGGGGAAFYLVLSTWLQICRWMQAKQVAANFRFAAFCAPGTLYAVRAVQDENLHTPRQRSSPHRRRSLLPVPVRFPAGFVAESLRPCAIDQSSGLLFPLALALPLFAAVIAWWMLRTTGAAVCAASLAITLCLPAGSLFALLHLWRRESRPAKQNGVAILNTDTAEACASAGAFVLDSPDLFLPDKGKMHGWHEYWQVRTDEVLLYAAAIAIEAGGPLHAVFNGVVEGDYSVLPPVHDLQYEDRMGLSCWIHNQKVFFGNRKLLENHGVAVSLHERDEKRYQHGGRQLLYLAVEKRLTAFFVVSYAPDPLLRDAFLALAREDMEPLVCNSDPAVNQDVLHFAFGKTPALLLLRHQQSSLCRKRMYRPAKHERAGVYHGNNARSFLRALAACVALRLAVRRARAFQIITPFVLFVLLLLFLVAKQLELANSLVFVGLSFVFGAATFAYVRSR